MHVSYETVYNARIADYHTYFVKGAADWQFSTWAHNSCDIRYGGNNISNKVIQYRKKYAISDGRNVAVIKYKNKSGKIKYVYGISDGKHAERIAFNKLPQYVKVNPAKYVRQLYTELEPCGFGHKCKEWLKRIGIADGKVYFSFLYSNDAQERIRDMLTFRKKLR